MYPEITKIISIKFIDCQLIFSYITYDNNTDKLHLITYFQTVVNLHNDKNSFAYFNLSLSNGCEYIMT